MAKNRLLTKIQPTIDINFTLNIMRILFVLRGELSQLPPVIALINSIAKTNNEVTIICNSCSINASESLNKKINVIVKPIIAIKFLRMILYRLKTWSILKKIEAEHDLLWIASAETAIALGRRLVKYDYYISVYELYDKLKFTKYRLKKYVVNAKKVFVPEYNRASIIRSWWKIKELPTIIPNTPNIDSEFLKSKIENIEIFKIVERIKQEHSRYKLIVYQGIIDENRRNLNNISKAIDEIEDCKFIIMGKDNNGYIAKLKNICSRIIHVDYISAPMHLYITQLAHIGILSYTFSSLNSIFCAPNKIYEYTAFGIPVIGNDIPGLKYIIEPNNIGLIFDEDNVDSIKKSIIAILSNFDMYSSNSTNFYKNINFDNQIFKLIEEVEYDKINN